MDKKKQSIFYLILLLFVLVFGNLKSQVTIGSGQYPSKGSILDLKDDGVYTDGQNSSKGLGLPRVELSDYTKLEIGGVVYDDKEAHTGMIVYNVADGSKDCNFIIPTIGVHVWNGERWEGINAQPPYTRKRPGPESVYAPNSYIAVAGVTNSVTIPVEKAFAMWDWWGGGNHPDGKLLAETSEDFTGNLSVKILWQESADGVIAHNTVIGTPTLDKTGLDRTAKITVPIKNTPGNAVVAIKDGTNKIRWSWHIWVPKDDPTITTYTHNTGRQENTFMDRYLGATRNGVNPADRNYTIGLYYQWGRKDAIPAYLKLDGTKSSLDVTITNNIKMNNTVLSSDGNNKQTTLLHSINNPLSIIGIADGSTSTDWYTLEDNAWNNRWGNSLDDCGKRFVYKSEVDPCPEGWRIPGYSGPDDADSPFAKEGVSSNKASEYTNNPVTVAARGCDFQSPNYILGWYPATGFRQNSGVPVRIKDSGYAWTSASVDIRSVYFAFDAWKTPAELEPWRKSSRVFSFNVRCVKEVKEQD